MKKSFTKSTTNAIITGRNMYQDKHGNIIYHHTKSHVAYRIKPEKQKEFSTYQSRYVLSIIAFVLFYILFKLSLLLSFSIAVAIAAFLEYQYRNFLKKCPQSIGFTKHDQIKSLDQSIDLSKKDLLLRIVLYASLAILLVINTFVSNNVKDNNALIVASYVVCILASFMTYKYIALFSRKA